MSCKVVQLTTAPVSGAQSPSPAPQDTSLDPRHAEPPQSLRLCLSLYSSKAGI